MYTRQCLYKLIRDYGITLSLFQDIVKVIRSAGETLEELSKEPPSEDRINTTATKFLKSLEVHMYFHLCFMAFFKYLLQYCYHIIFVSANKREVTSPVVD